MTIELKLSFEVRNHFKASPLELIKVVSTRSKISHKKVYVLK